MLLRLPVFTLTLMCSAVLLFTDLAGATVYQYFDEEGTLIVTNRPYGQKKRTQPQKHRPGLGIVPGIAYDYYSVPGRTLKEALSYLGPDGVNSGARDYAAQTRWLVGWSYAYKYTHERAGKHVRVWMEIQDVLLQSYITVLMPALTRRGALSRGEITRWDKYLQQFLAHEHNHVALIEDPIDKQAVLDSIYSVQELLIPAPPGLDLDLAVKKAVKDKTAKIGHAWIKRIKDRNNKYDRVTDHGRLEGTLQPPWH